MFVKASAFKKVCRRISIAMIQDFPVLYFPQHQYIHSDKDIFFFKENGPAERQFLAYKAGLSVFFDRVQGRDILRAVKAIDRGRYDLSDFLHSHDHGIYFNLTLLMKTDAQLLALKVALEFRKNLQANVGDLDRILLKNLSTRIDQLLDELSKTHSGRREANRLYREICPQMGIPARITHPNDYKWSLRHQNRLTLRGANGSMRKKL